MKLESEKVQLIHMEKHRKQRTSEIENINTDHDKTVPDECCGNAR